MTPTTRTAILVGLAALLAIVVPVPIAGIAVAAVLAAAAVDAMLVRQRPHVERIASHIVSRGIGSPMSVAVYAPGARVARVRQPVPPDIALEPKEARDHLDATLTAKRRGRHVLNLVAVRSVGPLGLGAWTHSGCGEEGEVLVYPDLVTARTLALAVRRGRFREAGQFSRGPLGLGTDFESIREYLPDDDIRQVNWLATARVGRPMSNQLRIEQDRDVLCVIDSGRLMAAPLGDRTRMDAAVDAATAVAFVADVVGDRCGMIAFDHEVRRRVRPRRSGGDAVVQAIFDLEPRNLESDYELAFRNVGDVKRAFVLVLTDLLEEAAARPLVDAIPILARRHHVVVASVSDPDLEAIIERTPTAPSEVYESAVALDVLRSRAEVVRRIRATGADVVEAPPSRLARACVASYLRAKARARL